MRLCDPFLGFGVHRVYVSLSKLLCVFSTCQVAVRKKLDQLLWSSFVLWFLSQVDNEYRALLQSQVLAVVVPLSS